MAPAHTTATGVRASSCKSAEMSKLACGAAVHAADAAGREHADAGKRRDDHRRGHRRRAGAAARDARSAGRAGSLFATSGPSRASRSSSRRARARPSSRPSTTAIVAGTAPSLRTSASSCSAVSKLLRPRHAVADDRRLERDHRLPRAQRGGDLVGKIERKRQYLTEQPYGVVLATVTGLPAIVSLSAART